MHGLVNTAIASFVSDTYGGARWEEVRHRAGCPGIWFETMLTYEPGLTDRLLDAMAQTLEKPRETCLEDLGTYVVSHPRLTAPRRLLRFSGASYDEFLHALEDLPERIRLAIPDFDLPPIRVRDDGQGQIQLRSGMLFPGYGNLLAGLLRAMADEYGALVTLDTEDNADDHARVTVRLHASNFLEGRSFALHAGGA